MGRFFIFFLGCITGLGGGLCWLWNHSQPLQSVQLSGAMIKLPVKQEQRQAVAEELNSHLAVNGVRFINAAIEVEKGRSTDFDLMVYDLGQQLNESVEKSLKLSPEAKTEMDRLLAANYPEIAAEARKEYLQKIPGLTSSAYSTITSTAFTTRAEVLAGALNSTICSFSTLIFIPLNLNFSIATNVAASYFFQSPCEVLLSGVTGYIGQQIYQSGLIRDLEETQTHLKLIKNTALAELATSQLEMQITSTHVVTRSIANNRLKWQGAKLTIKYDAAIKYGCDLTSDFEIARDDKERVISILLPEAKLLNVTLEPSLTDASDSGIPDLDSDDFRLLFVKAQTDAIQLAEKKGVKQNAQKEAETILSYIFAPFTTNSRWPYQLKFVNHNSPSKPI